MAQPRRSPGWERWTWLLAIGGAIFPLIVQRLTIDDSLYMNFAVAAVDSPSASLLQFDTLHGFAGLPIIYPVYKLHSFELLGQLLDPL